MSTGRNHTLIVRQRTTIAIRLILVPCVWQPYMQAHIEDVEAEKTERAMLNP